MGLLLSFTPLQRVPSLILNKIQASLFDQRANGVANTLAPGLAAVSSAWDSCRVQASLDFPVSPVGFLLDNSRDWRDRHITVEYRFDPLRDIRPGEAGDHLHPRDVGIATIYTGGGDRRLRCGPNLTLYVGPTGVLFVEKSQGWATVDITATCQLKERS